MNNLKRNIIVVTDKSWNIDNFYKIKKKENQYNWIMIGKNCDLNHETIKNTNPEFIFFPHWSWIIPKEIYENYECVVFHMTDLPFGRGGSPLQNLISRGVYATKISAIRAVEELDAGDIYMKEPFSLEEGSAEDIYKEASGIIFNKMIPFILRNKPLPKKQEGEVVSFKRRTPDQGEISQIDDPKKIYDYIRMLDAEGYPLAYIETPKLKIKFKRARFKDKRIKAECIIEIKNE